MEENIKINMGIDETGLGNANLLFVRKFRWTLDVPGLSHYFVKSVKFDHYKKTVKIKYYDVKLPDIDESFQALKMNDALDGNIVFQTCDGCGNMLYEIQFGDGLQVIKHTANFDYDSNDPAVRTITIHYKNEYRKFNTEASEFTTPSCKTGEETIVSYLNDRVQIV